MNPRAKVEKGSYFTLFAILLLAFSFLAPWVQFPLSIPINGVEYFYIMDSEIQSIFYYVVLVILGVVGYVYSEYRRLYKYNVFFIAISASLLLMVPAYLASRESSFILNYIQDTEDFRQIQRFFRVYFIPNKGSSLDLLSTDAFDTISSRLVSVFTILSWGWFLGAGCALVLFVYSAYRTTFFVLFFSLFIVLAPAGLIFGSTLMSMGYSFNAQRHLAQMDVTKSYGEMITAFRLDPLLKHSEKSTYFFSKLSYQIYGEDSASSVLYRAKQLELGGKRKQSMTLLFETLRNDKEDEYFSFIETQAEKQFVSLIIKVASRYYRQGFFDQALAVVNEGLTLLPSNRSLRMQKIYAYMKLGLTQDCLSVVSSVRKNIHTQYLQADFLSTIGECYLLDGQIANARSAFQQSLELDSTRNIRAIRGLSGS